MDRAKDFPLVHALAEEVMAPDWGDQTMMKWQPIDTAPKDTELLLYRQRPSRSEVSYDIGNHESVGANYVWYDAGYNELELYDWRVTHWMPLPEPPK